MNKREQAAQEMRLAAYRAGMVLRATATSKRDAMLKAASLEDHYPADKHGLVFEGRVIPLTSDWGVYALPEPYLAKGEEISPERAKELARRAREWGVVLVRQFGSSGSARTTASRDNAPDGLGALEPLKASGVKFRAQALGYGGRAATNHGEFAFIPSEGVDHARP